MALYLRSLGNRSVLILKYGGKHFKAFNFEDAFAHKIEGKLLKKHSQSWNETTPRRFQSLGFVVSSYEYQ